MQPSALKCESTVILPGKETYCHKGLLCWSLEIATGESLVTFGVGCWQDVLFQQDNAPAHKSMAAILERRMNPAHTSYSSDSVAPDVKVKKLGVAVLTAMSMQSLLQKTLPCTNKKVAPLHSHQLPEKVNKKIDWTECANVGADYCEEYTRFSGNYLVLLQAMS